MNMRVSNMVLAIPCPIQTNWLTKIKVKDNKPWKYMRIEVSFPSYEQSFLGWLQYPRKDTGIVALEDLSYCLKSRKTQIIKYKVLHLLNTTEIID